MAQKHHFWTCCKKYCGIRRLRIDFLVEDFLVEETPHQKAPQATFHVIKKWWVLLMFTHCLPHKWHYAYWVPNQLFQSKKQPKNHSLHWKTSVTSPHRHLEIHFKSSRRFFSRISELQSIKKPKGHLFCFYVMGNRNFSGKWAVMQSLPFPIQIQFYSWKEFKIQSNFLNFFFFHIFSNIIEW